MKANVVGLSFGAAIGFVMAWARLTDPRVIGDMLMLREPDVFFFMGSAIAVAAIGIRLLRALGARTLLTREPITWSAEAPQRKHVVGSVLFGLGWSVAGTCPGPVAIMVGEGRFSGLLVVCGLVSGIALQDALSKARSSGATAPDAPNAVGL
jgi:uncharacterized membrane protein YedE/YeeE